MARSKRGVHGFEVPFDPLPVGINTKVGEHRVQSAVIQMENWWPAWGDFGSIEIVPGYDDLGGMSSLGAFPIDTIAQVEKSSTQTRRWFLTGDTSTWLITDITAGSITPTKVKGGLTAGQKHAIVQFDDLVFFFNGVDTPYMYDFSSDTASAISNAALTQPNVGSMTATPTGTEGNVKKVVSYFVSFVEGTTENALSAAVTVDAGNGQTVDLANIPTGGGSTTARRLYRTIGDRTQPLFLASIDDDTTTTYTDDIADTSLGAVPPNHGSPAPDGVKYAIAHFNRIWIAGMNANEVWWSDLNNGRAYNSYSFMNVFEKDGDVITGLSRFKDGLIVWKNNHAYKVIGHDPDAEIMDIVEIKSSDPNSRAIGTPDQACVASTPMGHVFYFNRGIYLLDEGCSIQYLSGAIEDELLSDINQSAEGAVRSVYWADRRCVAISVPTGASTINDRTYLYWIDHGIFTRMSEGFNSMHTGEHGTDGARPDGWYWVANEANSTQVATIQRLDHPTARTFNGDNFTATYELGPIHGGDAMKWHQWLYCTMMFDPTATTDSINFNYNLHSDTGAGTDVSVDLVKTGFERWHRTINIGQMAPELNVTLEYTASTSSTEQIKIHGLHFRGNALGAQVHQ